VVVSLHDIRHVLDIVIEGVELSQVPGGNSGDYIGNVWIFVAVLAGLFGAGTSRLYFEDGDSDSGVCLLGLGSLGQLGLMLSVTIVFFTAMPSEAGLAGIMFPDFSVFSDSSSPSTIIGIL